MCRVPQVLRQVLDNCLKVSRLHKALAGVVLLQQRDCRSIPYLFLSNGQPECLPKGRQFPVHCCGFGRSFPALRFFLKPRNPVPLDPILRHVQRTRDGGAEIVKYLKAGSAYYAPSAAVVEMVEAILKDKKKILPCAAYLEGEYGINGLFVGVPAKLGARGIEQIIEVKLTAEESAALKKSADSVRELVDVIKV